jgi:hypothetical protein
MALVEDDMYRCEITGRNSRLGEKLNKVVAITRPKSYTRWIKNEETFKYEEVVVGTGFEIVRELSCSAEGEALWRSWTPEEREAFLKGM